MLRDVPPFGREADHDVFMTGAPGIELEHNNQADSLDDVFGSAPASPVLTGNNAAQFGVQSGRPAAFEHSDVPRLRSTHVTNGYREGIAISKEKHMQDGFDEGYTVGAELGLRAGRCLGVLEGIGHALRNRNANTGGDTSAQQLDELSKLRKAAEDELSMQSLFSQQYFGTDGIWTYEVAGSGDNGENEATFEQVAAAHPLIRRWDGAVSRLSEKLGLGLV